MIELAKSCAPEVAVRKSQTLYSCISPRSIVSQVYCGRAKACCAAYSNPSKFTQKVLYCLALLHPFPRCGLAIRLLFRSVDDLT
jgi:hypothetical protein